MARTAGATGTSAITRSVTCSPTTTSGRSARPVSRMPPASNPWMGRSSSSARTQVARSRFTGTTRTSRARAQVSLSAVSGDTAVSSTAARITCWSPVSAVPSSKTCGTPDCRASPRVSMRPPSLCRSRSRRRYSAGAPTPSSSPSATSITSAARLPLSRSSPLPWPGPTPARLGRWAARSFRSQGPPSRCRSSSPSGTGPAAARSTDTGRAPPPQNRGSASSLIKASTPRWSPTPARASSRSTPSSCSGMVQSSRARCASSRVSGPSPSSRTVAAAVPCQPPVESEKSASIQSSWKPSTTASRSTRSPATKSPLTASCPASLASITWMSRTPPSTTWTDSGAGFVHGAASGGTSARWATS